MSVPDLFKQIVDIQKKEQIAKIEIFENRNLLHEICEVQYHNFEVVEELIKLGLNINGRDGKRHRTPLHISVIKKDVIMVRKLLKLGATTKLLDVDGYTPLSYCIYSIILTNGPEVISSGLSIFKILLRYGACLTLSESQGRSLDFKTFLEKSQKINANRRKAFIAVITILGIKRFNKSLNMQSNNMDVIRLIGQMVWDTCVDKVWQ
jgi:hypothetical protein